MLLTTATYFCPTQVILGEGSHERIPGLLRDSGAQRVLLLVDPGLAQSAFVQKLCAELRAADIRFEVFTDILPDPSDLSVSGALDLAEGLDPEQVLAIGGGSTIDVGKAVAIVRTNGGRIHDYEGIEVYKTPPLPLIALPTTAGTGSEVSGSCVITNSETGLKMSIRHARMNPARIAILDPLALVTVPPHVACHSGLDAFVHAFESYIARNATPFTDALNLHAISLISGAIRQFVSNPSDTKAGLDMLCGSALAGMAFGQTGLGNVHCMARFVGARYHVSHGLSNALCLPVVARFNMIACPDRYADIARAMGCVTYGLNDLDAADLAVEAITRLCTDLGIPSHLSEVGAVEEDIPELADQCSKAGYEKWNPRLTTRSQFEQLFREAL